MNRNKSIAIFLITLLLFCSMDVRAEEAYRFRVYFKDKGVSRLSLEEPLAFLSEKTILRREKNNIPITESDMPISSAYLDSLRTIGVTPIVQSRWFSTVVVESTDSFVVQKLEQLPMVDSVKWIWKGHIIGYTYPSVEEDAEILTPKSTPIDERYGYANKQIEMLNGIKLHEAGYQGEGMVIAVIDAGFKNADRMSVFSSLNLLGTRNFVVPEESVFADDDHGTKVLSCMAANAPGLIVGTAPQAGYWLIVSEDNRSEYPVEEDYWTAAVEFADSLGVDVISSSLGYFTYDAAILGYNQEALDGNTALITRAARIAAEKGLLLFNSAGNEGNGHWGKITFPSDAPGILTVGAVTEEKEKSVFSSVGFTSDYRVKPDLVALGTGTCVAGSSGNISYASGTSFSTPILAGLGTCLWQALPWLSNKEIIELLKRTSSQYERPDAELGYGIPDIYEAYKKERN